MNTAVDNPDTAPADPATPIPDTASTAAKKSRGRPKSSTKSHTPETPQQRIDRLKAQLREAEDAKKIIEQQRDSIVGRIVVAHALANDQFRRQIGAILKAEVKGKAELTAISELLK